METLHASAVATGRMVSLDEVVQDYIKESTRLKVELTESEELMKEVQRSVQAMVLMERKFDLMLRIFEEACGLLDAYVNGVRDSDAKRLLSELKKIEQKLRDTKLVMGAEEIAGVKLDARINKVRLKEYIATRVVSVSDYFNKLGSSSQKLFKLLHQWCFIKACQLECNPQQKNEYTSQLSTKL
eukprot:TRINITY_DN12007_c0_g1_i1.p2 TRINITY_DN12007_c0_g1~~TRINITY_DN12007_c0_g1_i1.p2  ORF type:complete len:184 (+),score=18.20 TRINITY_DN12007_c0_g1_i1:358-909(+)